MRREAKPGERSVLKAPTLHKSLMWRDILWTERLQSTQCRTSGSRRRGTPAPPLPGTRASALELPPGRAPSSPVNYKTRCCSGRSFWVQRHGAVAPGAGEGDKGSDAEGDSSPGPSLSGLATRKLGELDARRQNGFGLPVAQEQPELPGRRGNSGQTRCAGALAFSGTFVPIINTTVSNRV